MRRSHLRRVSRPVVRYELPAGSFESGTLRTDRHAAGFARGTRILEASGHESVPHAHLRFDRVASIAELRSEPADVDVHGPGSSLVGSLPHLSHELWTRDERASVTSEDQ